MALSAARHAAAPTAAPFASLAMPFSPKRPKRLRGKRPPTLHIADILAWADEHKARTGKWPTQYSGRVVAMPNESWTAINQALSNGHRGFPGGWTLARLLAKYR